MKTYAIILVTCWLATHSFTMPSIVILDFEYDYKNITLNDKAYSICEEVKHQIINSQKVIVVERAKINKILEEQQISEVGLCDKACYAKIGKLTGAQFLLFGVVSIGDTYIRVIDAETGSIIRSFSMFENGQKIPSLANAVVKYLIGKTKE